MSNMLVKAIRGVEPEQTPRMTHALHKRYGFPPSVPHPLLESRADEDVSNERLLTGKNLILAILG